MAKVGRGLPAPKSKRRVKYGPNVVRLVCEDLASGMTYNEVTQGRGRPSHSSLYEWRRRYPEFAEATDAARAFGAEVCGDRALEVAEQATEETVRKAKLEVDTLVHRAAVLAPERWGGRGAGLRRAEPIEVVFSVRRFEKVVGPDGRVCVREIKPEGEV
ncbi:MAG: hypothetical protein EPN98_03545 [Phenylobacterium sp.]|uniref:terminase small subunit-like protein n=1 Tax=Phenylobacterium sp. TaxID=1871053 RepID=UPI0011F702C9|nr:hypothetical protein [Phenylobacterium sp.]TAL37370.1 MAG: hypothetical protein EPN98_03545 [Phenylobacterium sp.]